MRNIKSKQKNFLNKVSIRVFVFLLLFQYLKLHAQTGTLIVAQDGTGDFTTVQEAFNSVPLNNKKPVSILIKKGVYKERLILHSSKSFVSITGEDKNSTILTFNNYSGLQLPNGDTVNTYTSASFFLNADDFKAMNLTFQNDAGFTAGQAVAVFAKGDKLIFNNCNFKGFQDVLFCSGAGSRQYYKNCYIEGTTDFIFGPSTAVFQNCKIHSKKNSHITAASTPKDVAYGFVFIDCRLTADSTVNNVSLGRPWSSSASVTYIRCELGKHITPEGWNNWKKDENEKTARYAEYKNFGEGANPELRVSWARQLSEEEAKTFTLKNIFQGWNPAKHLNL